MKRALLEPVLWLLVVAGALKVGDAHGEQRVRSEWLRERLLADWVVAYPEVEPARLAWWLDMHRGGPCDSTYTRTMLSGERVPC